MLIKGVFGCVLGECRVHQGVFWVSVVFIKGVFRRVAFSSRACLGEFRVRQGRFGGFHVHQGVL